MKALGGIYESGDRIDDQPTAGVPVHVSAEGGHEWTRPGTNLWNEAMKRPAGYDLF